MKCMNRCEPGGRNVWLRHMLVCNYCIFNCCKNSSHSHADLNLLFMLPEYRNQGAGALSVEWGTRLADEMGLGASVEARHMGKGVYERYGFVVMHIVDWRFENAAPNDEWKRMVEELHKYPLAVMWRPEGGKYVKGETVVPWEGSPRE